MKTMSNDKHGAGNMEIEVKIRALMMDPNSGTPIMILKDVNSETI